MSDNDTNDIYKGKARKQDPLHGITLKVIVSELYEKFGWEILSQKINIKYFSVDPSISSSLKFLHKTDWARKKLMSFT